MKKLLDSLLSRYVVAGVAGTAVHFALLWLLTPALGLLLGSSVGATAGAVVNYLLLRGWVFSDRSALPIYYVALCVLSVTLNALLMAVVSSRGVSGFVAQMICSCVLMIVNFAVSNGWVFRYETTRFK